MGVGVAGEFSSEFLAGTKEPTHHRSNGNITDFRDFLITQLFERPEQEHHAMLGRQGVDSAFDFLIELLPVDLVDVLGHPGFGMMIGEQVPERLIF